MSEKHSGSKYLRFVRPVPDARVVIDAQAGRMAVEADVYQVIESWGVTNPAQAHALKKVLCAGGRGKGSFAQDVVEAIDALKRAVQIEADREADKEYAAEQETEKWRKVVEDTRAQVREAVDSLTVRPEPADAPPPPPHPTPALPDEAAWDKLRAKVDSMLKEDATAWARKLNQDAWAGIEKIKDKDGPAVAPVLQSRQGGETEPLAPEGDTHDRTRTPEPDGPLVDQQSGGDPARGRDAPGDYGGRTRRPVPVLKGGHVPSLTVAAGPEADRPPDIMSAPPGSPPPWGDPPADRGTAGHESSASSGH